MGTIDKKLTTVITTPKDSYYDHFFEGSKLLMFFLESVYVYIYIYIYIL